MTAIGSVMFLAVLVGEAGRDDGVLLAVGICVDRVDDPGSVHRVLFSESTTARPRQKTNEQMQNRIDRRPTRYTRLFCKICRADVGPGKCVHDCTYSATPMIITTPEFPCRNGLVVN